MIAPGTQAPLRPLGLGEVLDRAVTLCVRNFMPLTLIFIVYAVPLAVVQFFATRDFAGIMQTISAAVAAGAGKPPDVQALSRSLSGIHTGGWYAILLATAFFVGPLPTAALISATAQRYLGGQGSFAGAYRQALGRWLPLVAINGLYLFALVLAYVALVVFVIAIVFGLAFLTAALRGVGIALDVLIGGAAFVAMVLFFVVALLAFQVSYFTCVVEGAGPVRSFARGVRRVFVGIGLKRSLLVGVIFLAIGIGIAIVSAIGDALLSGLFRSAVAGTTYATIVRVGTAAFTTAFIAIFYFDLRVREEGLDLQLAAQSVREHPTPST